jgi:hypothetical protein
MEKRTNGSTAVLPDETTIQSPAPPAREAPRFRCRQFLEQFPMQLFYPFSLPLAFLWSPGYALNLSSLETPLSARSLLFFVCIALPLASSPLLCVLFWALSQREEDVVVMSTLRADLVHVLVALFSMRLAMAVKYAYMPAHTYAARLKREAPREARADEQLLSGWQFLSAKKIRSEVAAAAAAQPLDVEPLRVSLRGAGALARLCSELACGEAGAVITAAAEARGGARDGEGAALAVPVAAFAEAILLAAETESKAYAMRAVRLNMAGSLVSTFTTAVVRAALRSPQFGHDVYQLCAVVTHWVANLVILGVTLTFLMVGAVDHFRRARSHALLGGFFSAQRGAAAPALDLADPENAHAFIAARGLLCAFGEAYHERLVLVTACSLATFLVVAAYVVASLYTSPAGSALGLALCPFILLHVLVWPAFACILAGLFQAARANSEMSKHTAVVVQARLRARMARLGGADEGKAAAPSFALLEDLECWLRASQHEAAVSIWGFEVTGAFGARALRQERGATRALWQLL